MNLLELKKQITNKSLNKIYYFTGDEWKVMNIYIHQIAKASNSKLEYVDSIKDVIDNVKQKSILSTKSCYVMRDDKEYLSNEKLWDKINELNKDNILIFILSSIDKRSKFYKRFKDDIVTFDKLNELTLTKYINNAITLENASVKKLIEVCEYDYGRILLEIDKIKNYGSDYNNAFLTLLANGEIYQPPKDAVFDLIDAILSRNAILSYRLYKDCKDIGEANLVILSNLFNSTRATYQVQSFVGNGDICNITGLKQGQIYACQKRLYRYTNEELIYIMKLTQKVEAGIKQGTIPDEISIEYLLANIFK